MHRIPQIWPGWQVDELIGRGSYGKVYKASRAVGEHISHAAIKIIEIPRDDSEVASLAAMGMDALSIRSYYEETAQSVVREVALMDKLKGAPGIVHIEDYQLVEREDGVGWTIFIRMELLESLTSYIARKGAPDTREAVRIGVDICRGLEYCHQAGIIHRDVKPENVFRTAFGEYRLGDFGLARVITEGSRSTMSTAGTGPYMAPEVMGGHYDASVDTYSLGIMLYRWLNGGRPPFVRADETPTHALLEEAQLQRLSGKRPPLPVGAPAELAAIIRRAIEPKPLDRWPSAKEFGDALQDWLDGKKGLGVADAGETPTEAPTETPEKAAEESAAYVAESFKVEDAADAFKMVGQTEATEQREHEQTTSAPAATGSTRVTSEPASKRPDTYASFVDKVRTNEPADAPKRGISPYTFFCLIPAIILLGLEFKNRVDHLPVGRNDTAIVIISIALIALGVVFSIRKPRFSVLSLLFYIIAGYIFIVCFIIFFVDGGAVSADDMQLLPSVAAVGMALSALGVWISHRKKH